MTRSCWRVIALSPNSVEPQIGPAHTLNPDTKEASNTLGCLDAPTVPEPPTEPVDRPSSPDQAVPQHQSEPVAGIDDQKVAPVAGPPSSTRTPLEQSEARVSGLEEEEREIKKIVGKRRAETGYEYKVRWKDMWLPKSELGDARRLLREFEAQRWG